MVLESLEKCHRHVNFLPLQPDSGEKQNCEQDRAEQDILEAWGPLWLLILGMS